jgi:hypothetical protein
MPMIVSDRRKRLAYLFGRQSGIRSTGETLEQVQEQLRPNVTNMRSTMPISRNKLPYYCSRLRSCDIILLGATGRRLSRKRRARQE